MSTADPTLDYIQTELQEKYGCHTIILYGSRARSEGSATSDYDVMGVRQEGGILRDARVWNGLYLDLFVYPEADILEPAASMVYMRGGRVLVEKDGIGARFLESLEKLYAAGPEKLREDEIAALKVWAEKSLLRIKAGGIEGNIRRAELLPAVLEHYFNMRGIWYRGPKESLQYLKTHRADLYQAFDAALQPGASISAIEQLVAKLNAD